METDSTNFYIVVHGPQYSGKSRYLLASSPRRYYSTDPVPLTYQSKKYELNLWEGAPENLPNAIPSAIVITFDSTRRSNFDEVKLMVEQQQKINPKMPLILMATRCDLHRSLLFDPWPYIREILVSFQPGKIDYGCTLTQLNYDVITVILEFLSDATIKIANQNFGVLFEPTRNCTGVPITKWECRKFARAHEIGVIFTSSREVINIHESHLFILRKILAAPKF